MTKDELPKYTDLMSLTLEGLQALGGSASIFLLVPQVKLPKAAQSGP